MTLAQKRVSICLCKLQKTESAHLSQLEVEMSIMAEFGNFARFEENQSENIDFESKTQLWLLSEVKIRKYTFELIGM